VIWPRKGAKLGIAFGVGFAMGWKFNEWREGERCRDLEWVDSWAVLWPGWRQTVAWNIWRPGVHGGEVPSETGMRRMWEMEGP